MRRPDLVLQFHDAEHGVDGFLVIDCLVRGVAAGGLRIAPGVSQAEVEALARNMTAKQAAAGIEVGGAKAGLDMPPDAPHRTSVLRRFLGYLRPLVLEYLSLGPDMNTTLKELESIGRELGIPCLKIAVGRSRGLSDEEFLSRYALLESATPLGTVNQLRPCAAVAEAVLAALETLGERGAHRRIAIQGAGTMGGGAARLLVEAGCRVVAWSDDRRCLHADDGLPVARLSERRRMGRFDSAGDSFEQGAPATLFDVECDVLVLAAISDAIHEDQVPTLRCGAIVEAANLAVRVSAERRLHEHGVLVIPDLVASVGGSLAVESLYVGNPTSGADILDHVRGRAGALVRDLIAESRHKGVPPRSVLEARLPTP